jgi:hypothetical protein
MPKIEATPITRWKCPDDVSVVHRQIERTLSEDNPVMPPATKQRYKADANSIAVVKRMRAPHSVPSQLKVFTAEGTPIDKRQNRKRDRRVRAHAADEHVVAPHERIPADRSRKIANTIAR